MTNIAELPDQITKIAHWSVYKNKFPQGIDGGAIRKGESIPSLSFADAQENLKKHNGDGLSFNFKDTPFCYSDLDTYKKNADKGLHDQLVDIACSDTYVEVSMSGKGHHIVYRGEQYKNGNGIDNKGSNLLFMTGDSIGCPTIGELSETFVQTSGFKLKPKFDPMAIVEPTDIAEHFRAILTADNYNDSLCSLSASFAAKGMDHKQIFAVLMGALDASPGGKTRLDARKKHLNTVVSTALEKFGSSETSETEIITPDWPVLSSQALPGIVGEFVDLATRSSEADPAAVLSTFLVRFGIDVGAGPHMMIGDAVHHCRFASVIVGESGKARKGS